MLSFLFCLCYNWQDYITTRGLLELNENKMKSFPWLSLGLVIILIIMLALSFNNTSDNKEITPTKFQTEVTAGTVKEVRSVGTVIYGIYTTSTFTQEQFEKNGKYDFYLEFVVSTQFSYYLHLCTEHDVVIYRTEPAAESFWSQMLPYLSLIFIVGSVILMLYMFNKMNGKNMDFGKNKARLENGQKVTFEDVAGCDEEKREMQEIVEFLKNPKKFTDLGARIPKGVLLVGPPGTGKTLLAKAIAGEAGVPFFSITGSDFVEMFVGVGAARVRDLFDTAKKNMPCLIFIDEIDAVGRHRGTGIGNTNDEREQTLNQLLVQMDGFESNDGVVVIAATNRPDVLDPALLRAGRFDRQIVVNAPDVRGREKILKLYAKGKPFSDKINFASVSRILAGATGADIENILNEAAILAARDNRALITQSDIMEGISKVTMGPQKRSSIVSDDDKKNTSYHESGHTIVAKSCENIKDEVQEVSIIQRGRAAGYTAHNPMEESTQYTREQMLDHIRIAMGGRAAEIIKFGKIGTGASNDLKRATELARRMVTEFGMSDKLGPVYYAGENEMFLGRDMQSRNNISEHTAEIVDGEIKSILENALDEAITVLRSKIKILDNMSEVLLQKETIYSQDVDELMQGKSVKVVIKNIEERDKEHEAEDKAAREAKIKKDEEKEKLEKEQMEMLRASALAAFNGVAVEDKNVQNETNKDGVKIEVENKPENEEHPVDKNATILEEPKPKSTNKTMTKKSTTTDRKDSDMDKEI